MEVSVEVSVSEPYDFVRVKADMQTDKKHCSHTSIGLYVNSTINSYPFIFSMATIYFYTRQFCDHVFDITFTPSVYYHVSVHHTSKQILHFVFARQFTPEC